MGTTIIEKLTGPSRDFTVDTANGCFAIIPHTQEAREFVAEKIHDGVQEWCGGITVEPNFIVDLVQSLRTEGFKVNT